MTVQDYEKSADGQARFGKNLRKQYQECNLSCMPEHSMYHTSLHELTHSTFGHWMMKPWVAAGTPMLCEFPLLVPEQV